MEKINVEFDANNGLVSKKGEVVNFIVKENETFAIVIVGSNFYEIKLNRLKIIKDKE